MRNTHKDNHRGQHGTAMKHSAILRGCLLALFGMLFVAGVVMISRILIEQMQAKTAYTDIQSLAQSDAATDPDAQSGMQTASNLNFALLQGINPDIKAWLFSEGTDIDYPVLQASDNSYYLSHLYTGESNSSGSLFLDYRNTGIATDRNTVIYGHNMRDTTMLGSLESYKEQEYFDSHPTMKLYTPNGVYVIELICGTAEDGNFEFVQFEFANESSFEEYIESHISRSTFQSNVSIQPGDHIISLCTCSFERNNGRYMVIGKLTQVSTDS